MTSSLVEKTAEMVQKKFEHDRTGHDWNHIFRVWQMARRIALGEHADMETVELAALLHDIADWKEHKGDFSAGPREARAWLQSQSADARLMDRVCEIIPRVSFKGAAVADDMPWLEGKIVQDADRLDANGAIGLVRAIQFGAMKNRVLYDPAIAPKHNMDQESHTKETLNPANDTTINHVYEKNLHLKNRMHTNTAKRIAEQRHNFTLQFLDQFKSEWNLENAKSISSNKSNLSNVELELERTFLAKELPKDVFQFPLKEMLDIYIPEESGHATLRVRKNGLKFEITRKKPRLDDPSEMTEETIRITPLEFESFLLIPGLRVHKNRVAYRWKGFDCEVDVFLDGLAGLVLVDFEFKTIEAKNAFQKPDFCLAEVTHEEFTAGGMLCGKKYSDLEPHLSKYHYRSIRQPNP